jgi:hypothetical protein
MYRAENAIAVGQRTLNGKAFETAYRRSSRNKLSGKKIDGTYV